MDADAMIVAAPEQERLAELPAGRDLDRRIADILGDRLATEGEWAGWWVTTDGLHSSHEDGGPRPYSTAIAEAWRVVLKMNATPCRDGDHFVWRLEGCSGKVLAIFEHHLSGTVCDDKARPFEHFEALADTAPHAICLAALAACEAVR